MKEHKTPYNAKGNPHGLWERYWVHGELWFRTVYINGKENGYEEYSWDNDGKVTEKTYYL